MTIQEAIEIIEVERACVKRNTDNKCDRDCINCDLLRTEEEIFAAYDMAIESLEKAEKYRWIPVKVRSTTEEDGIDMRKFPWFLDFPLPEDGERILVSRNGYVDVDENVMSERDCYLDSWGDWADVEAWMPLPAPYKKEEE